MFGVPDQAPIDLPHFASFPLLQDPAGRARIKAVFLDFVRLAKEQQGVSLLLDTITWRANAECGDKLGLSPAQLDQANRDAVEFIREIQAEHASPDFKILLSGTVGPRGDGYKPGSLMTPDQAEAYHKVQVGNNTTHKRR